METIYHIINAVNKLLMKYDYKKIRNIRKWQVENNFFKILIKWRVTNWIREWNMAEIVIIY